MFDRYSFLYRTPESVQTRFDPLDPDKLPFYSLVVFFYFVMLFARVPKPVLLPFLLLHCSR